MFGGHRDHGEIDRTGDGRHVWVGGHRLHDLGPWVHRIHRSGEPIREQVVKDLAADGPALPRGADDRDRARREEGLQRVHGSRLLARFEVAQRVRRQRGGKLLVDLPRLDVRLGGKAGVAEHVEHLDVVRQDFGFKEPDLVGRRDFGQVAQHDRPQAAPLVVLRNRERDLRALAVERRVHGVADDAFRRTGRGHEPKPAHIVHVRHLADLLDQGVVTRAREEAPYSRVVRKAAEKTQQHGLVVGANRPHVDGGAVPQDNIGLAVRRIRRWPCTWHVAIPSSKSDQLCQPGTARAIGCLAE